MEQLGKALAHVGIWAATGWASVELGTAVVFFASVFGSAAVEGVLLKIIEELGS